MTDKARRDIDETGFTPITPPIIGDLLLSGFFDQSLAKMEADARDTIADCEDWTQETEEKQAKQELARLAQEHFARLGGPLDEQARSSW